MLAKAGIAVLAAILFLPVLIAAVLSGAISALFGGSASSIDCTLAGDSGGVAGYGPDQLANAAIIVAVGKQMNIPEQGWLVAIAAALQESGLRNLDYGDRDSLGLFQQRPSQGWGSPAEIMNPTYAATQFYQHLLAVPGWQQMSLTEAAQAVQRSAFPDAYAQHEQTARVIVATVQGANCTPRPTPTPPCVPETATTSRPPTPSRSPRSSMPAASDDFRMYREANQPCCIGCSIRPL